jgi:hypothetical protein
VGVERGTSQCPQTGALLGPVDLGLVQDGFARDRPLGPTRGQDEVPNSQVRVSLERRTHIRREQQAADAGLGDAVPLVGKLIETALLIQPTSECYRLAIHGRGSAEIMCVPLAGLRRKRHHRCEC